ncbi:MAG: acyl-CoA/acyl-ACP dehydrogenase [Aeromicrobium erythreum]
MLFELTDDHRGFGDSVDALLRRHVPASRLREAWSDAEDYTSPVWKPLAHLGLLGVLVPEDLGGAGGDYLDLVLPLEAAGRHAVPEPLVESVAILPSVLLTHGSQAEQERWLGPLAAGDLVAATMIGESDVVADGARADVLLVADGDALHLVPRDGFEARPVTGVDPGRRPARCAPRLDATTLLSDDPAALQLARAVGAAATASVLVGLCDHLVTTTRDYLLQREQFGQPIGAFQALKHRLADVAVATEAARSLSWRAAYDVSVDAPDLTSTALAKASASEAARLAGSAALQLHGGIGFTWEHDLHLWLQRGRVLEAAFGTAHSHREAVGARLLADHPRDAA